MPHQPCAKCGRPNPPDAAYCHFDGIALGGGTRSGPVAVGSRPFNSPFVFPNGRSCRSFDELALACQEEWQAACSLLKDGFLEQFLGGMGRIDLALAAKQASLFPDLERGLDQLLAKLPSSVLADPKLKADPLEVNLGVFDGLSPRTMTLELENQGMRLLYGTVTSDCLWLTLGEGAAGSEKHFHFTDEGKVSVTIRPDLVRASSKPVEGRLEVTSNGGTAVAVFRAEKPIKPFPPGPLGGAMRPRQVAEKAMASPKEVAPLFESGEVEQWYALNGWTYPVKLPAASGIAAIQQFFEALGLTKAPKVQIDRKRIDLSAAVGSSHTLSVEVSTEEKRPVFAHATSNVPWLEVGRPRFGGKSATVPMSIPSVPNMPGQTLHGEVTVISNGNARWSVPVTLEVSGGAFDFASPAAPLPPPPPPPPPPSRAADTMQMQPLSLNDSPEKPRARRPARGENWLGHSLPAVLLLLAVAAVVVYDRVAPLVAGDLPNILGPKYDPKSLADPQPRIALQYGRDNKFGIARLDGSKSGKRLTFSDVGETNNTYVKIDGKEIRFGYLTRGRSWYPDSKDRPLPAPYRGRMSTFRFGDEGVDVAQYTQIIPGQANTLGTSTLDTALVYYRATNTSKEPHKVALRVLLDTFIGERDDVPFLIPGQSKLVSDKADLAGKAIPPYLEVIENPDDPKNPGTVARLGLKGVAWAKDIPLEEPSRVVICKFPGETAGWDWDLKDIKDGKEGKADSGVAVYWPEVEIKPGKSVHFAFTYGLAALEFSADIVLGVASGVLPGATFDVTGYVYNAKRGQKVRLELPAGLEAVEGLERGIDADAARAVVTWKVKAGSKEGRYQISAGDGKKTSAAVVLRVESIF